LSPLPPAWGGGGTDFLGYYDCLFYNRTAYLMVAVSFGLAAVLLYFLRDRGPDTLLILCGVLAAVIDLAYRVRGPVARLLRADLGGRFLFMPLWVFGVFWLCLGLLGASG
jgi:hypothetical protein